MTAYSFKRRFIEPMRAGTKTHTIRARRKTPPIHRAAIGGHALPGEELQLYTAMRTRSCELIGTARCLRVIRITFELVHSWVDLYETPGKKPRRLNCYDGNHVELDPFARADGFDNFKSFWDYWNETGQVPAENGLQLFDGWLIEWGDTFNPPAAP